MAKRKAARAGRAGAAAKRAGTGGGRGGAKKKGTSSRRAAAGRKKATKRAASKARSTARTATATRARKAAAKTKSSKKTARKQAARKQSSARKTAARRTTAPRATPRSSGAARATVPVRKSPALNRPRRVVADEPEDIVQSTPPSSLDLDRSASAARTGRRSLRDRYSEHTETSPALTGGDVDADWESAYSVGDEAPGGDNPTPDQDIVDDIGRAVGIEYQDNEELKGADKLEKRDRKRWELDPASSEDWDER